MITIEVNSNKKINSLAAYIMENLHVVAVIKNKSIMIDDIVSIEMEEVISTIKRFMRENGIDGEIIKKDRIIVTMNTSDVKTQDHILNCPHCGKISLYEEEMDVHIKSHYIGF
ncbi:MAG: hypothetical protein QW416_07595 [Candidatus Nitrosocaldaceae archaeon]